jgi:hypothetical protein
LVQEKQLLAGEEASAALRDELSVARAELERERSEKKSLRSQECPSLNLTVSVEISSHPASSLILG